MSGYGFLFGAGVEKCYHLPLGADYTVKTMLCKREGLYDALKEFYDSFDLSGYANRYEKHFMFSKNSHTFKEMIIEAAKYGVGKKWDECSKEVVDCFYDEYGNLYKNKDKNKDDNSEIIEKVYKALIVDLDNQGDDLHNCGRAEDKYKDLRANIKYQGAIEKDFATISEPNSTSIHRFWRLINYFWSAFFTILFPLMDNCEKYKNNENYKKIGKNGKYKFVLENLKEILDYINSPEVLENYNYNEDESYYSALSKKFEPKCILTTNYTPFIEIIFKEKDIQLAYLAGKISQFEIPQELTVKDFKECNFKNGKMLFPFLMTQAPIKPIIVPSQIKEYALAINLLETIDTLIIIGYSMDNADNHINAILRNFICQKNKKIIYCPYDEKGELNINEEIEKCKRKLRIDNGENIKIILNNGNVENLISEIDKNL